MKEGSYFIIGQPCIHGKPQHNTKHISFLPNKPTPRFFVLSSRAQPCQILFSNSSSTTMAQTFEVGQPRLSVEPARSHFFVCICLLPLPQSRSKEMLEHATRSSKSYLLLDYSLIVSLYIHSAQNRLNAPNYGSSSQWYTAIAVLLKATATHTMLSAPNAISPALYSGSRHSSTGAVYVAPLYNTTTYFVYAGNGRIYHILALSN